MGTAVDTDRKQAIREAYENTDKPIAAICREFDVSRSWFDGHRKADGWVRADIEAVTVETVNAVEDAYAEIQVDLGQSSNDDEMSRLQAELAEAKSKLKQFEPESYEWITDLSSAERVLGPRLDEMVESRWEEYVVERRARSLPVAELTPEWAEREKQKILAGVLADRSKSATNEGPATRVQAWLKPDGKTVVQIPYDISIGNYAASPTEYENNLKRKGFKKLTPQPCMRMNCDEMSDKAYDGYCGPVHRALDEEIDKGASRATTTGSFSL